MQFTAKPMGSAPRHTSLNFLPSLRVGILVQGNDQLESVVPARKVQELLSAELELHLKSRVERYKELSLPKNRVELKEELRRILTRLNETLHLQLRKSAMCPGLGYSLELILLLGDFSIVAHVGTTKTYLYQLSGSGEGRLLAVTRPETKFRRRQEGHSRVAEIGSLTDDHDVANGLGLEPSVNVTFVELPLTHQDRYVLGTYSLGRMARDIELHAAFGNSEATSQLDPDRLWKNLSQFSAPPIEPFGLAVDVFWPDQNQSEASIRKLFELQKVLGVPALFQGLSEQQQISLLSLVTVRAFKAGQTVVKKDDSTRDLYLLLQGELEILTKDGRNKRESKPGAFFGELSYLLKIPRTATVVAVAPSYVLELSAAEFDQLLSQNKAIQGPLYRNIAHILADRFLQLEHSMNVQIEH